MVLLSKQHRWIVPLENKRARSLVPTQAGEHFHEETNDGTGGRADSPSGDVEGGHGSEHGEHHGGHRRPQRPRGGRRLPPRRTLPDLHRDLELGDLHLDPARALSTGPPWPPTTRSLKPLSENSGAQGLFGSGSL